MSQPLTAPRFDAALIEKYDHAGPRYTSYPTAANFSGAFDEASLRAMATASNEEPIPADLSLYIHVPFCHSPCFYCGCSRVINRNPARTAAYLRSLGKEIALTAAIFDTDRRVRQVHFGGGTPNSLAIEQVAYVMGFLEEQFTFDEAQACEIGIELDPRFADRDYVRSLARLGFNRASVGIQDFDPRVQQAVNRVQSLAETREVLQAARRAGFRSTSVDLIYGLPRQTLEGFGRTLDDVVELNPDRVAVYGYAHLPGLFKAQGRIHPHDLPSAPMRLELFALALERLTAAGYAYVGMDHFARDTDDLMVAQRAGTLQRNFQGYATHGRCDIIGMGPSAISRIGESYSQNAKDLQLYEARLDAGFLPVSRGIVLNADDVIRRDAINTLMCSGELERKPFAERHRLDFNDYFAATLVSLAALQADGLVAIDEAFIRVTAKGRLLLRCVAMCFDAYRDRAVSASRLI